MEDEIEEEVERRLASYLKEIGEEPWSDSDRAMFLRQDLRIEVANEFESRTTLDHMKKSTEER